MDSESVLKNNNKIINKVKNVEYFGFIIDKNLNFTDIGIFKKIVKKLDSSRE